MPRLKRLQRAGFILGAALLCTASVHAGIVSSPPTVQVVDDRGNRIDEVLDLCFQVELRNDCQRLKPRGRVHPPGSFFGLRIEGENHGPVYVRREALQKQSDGSFRIEVPRKAWLRIAGEDLQLLTISLYLPENPTFREPAFRVQMKSEKGEIKVPAGEFIASLSLALNAPDLHRLRAAPASRVELTYHRRKGWSLVARIRSATSFRPVSRTQVEIMDTVGYGEQDRPVATAVSGADGLVLLSGLLPVMASLTARHPEFISSELRGLTATPGTFAFRTMDLGTGGRIAARITIHGRPLARATCYVYSPLADARDREPLRQLWEGFTDSQGLCRSARLAQGFYKLRVRILESTAQVNRWVSVLEAQDTQEDVALAPTRIYGVVRRGAKAARGYSVEAILLDSGRPPRMARADTSAESVSDDEGRYEFTVWTPGRYGLMVRSPSKTPAASQRDLTTDGDDERQVDFDLNGTAFEGRVVDEDGQPVEAAHVGLRWEGVRVAHTDAEGRFEFPVEGEGTAMLHAMKSGYRESESVDVQVKREEPIPFVTLVLRRKATIEGKVLSAAGNPVPNAWVGSIEASLERGPFLYSATRSTTDGGFEVEIPLGPPRVFVSGPGCPLSWFDLPTTAQPDSSGDSGAPVVVRCPALPSALELNLVDSTGKPLPHAGVIIRRNGTIVPGSVLATHLQLLGLPAETDGTGHLVLAGLAPGEYELYLNTRSSESAIAIGHRQGYLSEVSLPALQTTELQLTLPPE
ncbi:MAG TPA: carboxypeptidase regulatory-like domain-containing protein [Thermoanaerobaculia bacterium]|jgi:protocatechuate 3,4-dioxygenase beta subunit|nr:carboxypeptidase regulatory-like domain-containing protein [Thermoanaerobaculia bacterium]